MLIKMLSLVSILVLSSCGVTGDFCDIARDLRQSAAEADRSYDVDEAWSRNLAKHNSDYLSCP